MARNNEQDFVQCLRCKHGQFMQWFDNPVIASCKINNERQVAEAKRLCKWFAASTSEPVIEHYDSYTSESS